MGYCTVQLRDGVLGKRRWREVNSWLQQRKETTQRPWRPNLAKGGRCDRAWIREEKSTTDTVRKLAGTITWGTLGKWQGCWRSFSVRWKPWGEGRFPTAKVQLGGHVRNPGKRGWDLNQSNGRSGGKEQIPGYTVKSAGFPGGRKRCTVFKRERHPE